MTAQTLKHNEVTQHILSLDLGTDTARVHRTIVRGGQPLIDAIGAFLSIDAINGMNQKAIMRAVQAVSFAVSGAVEDFDKVTGAVIAAVMLSAQETIEYSAMRYAAGQSNMIDPGSIQGVSRSKFMRFIGKGGTAKTIESKVSRSVGKRGFLTGLGVVAKSDNNHFTLQKGARESGFVLGFAYQLQSMTEGAFALVMGDDE